MSEQGEQKGTKIVRRVLKENLDWIQVYVCVTVKTSYTSMCQFMIYISTCACSHTPKIFVSSSRVLIFSGKAALVASLWPSGTHTISYNIFLLRNFESPMSYTVLKLSVFALYFCEFHFLKLSTASSPRDWKQPRGMVCRSVEDTDVNSGSGMRQCFTVWRGFTFEHYAWCVALLAQTSRHVLS